MMKATALSPQEAEKLGDNFQFELKYDGFRALYSDGNILSERGIRQNHKFPQIANALAGGFNKVVLDGEIAIEGGTIHEINASVNWSKAVYYVFDILFLDGVDLRQSSLVKRQGVLRMFVERLGSPYVQFVRKFEDFKSGWAYVQANKCEGLVAKSKSSEYLGVVNLLEETRSKAWLKIKSKKERVFVMSEFERHQDDDGITFTDGFHRFSVRGDLSREARQIIAKNGKCLIEVQYLYETQDKHLFQAVIKRVREVVV
jgi:ATP-dependent DNA ligase